MYQEQEEKVILGEVPTSEIVVPRIDLVYHSEGELPASLPFRAGKDAAQFVRQVFKDGEIKLQEVFIVIYLNNQSRPVGYYKAFKGGIASVIADPVLIFSAAIRSHSTALILVHNHPSGILRPSQQDLILTRQISDIAKIHNVRVLDHLIITQDGYYSFKENGQDSYLYGVDQEDEGSQFSLSETDLSSQDDGEREGPPGKHLEDQVIENLKRRPRRIPKLMAEGSRAKKILFVIQELFKRLSFPDLIPVSITGSSVAYRQRTTAAIQSQDWNSTKGRDVGGHKAGNIFRKAYPGGKLRTIFKIATAVIKAPQEFVLLERPEHRWTQVYRGDLVLWSRISIVPDPSRDRQYFVLGFRADFSEVKLVGPTSCDSKGFWVPISEIYPPWFKGKDNRSPDPGTSQRQSRGKADPNQDRQQRTPQPASQRPQRKVDPDGAASKPKQDQKPVATALTVQVREQSVELKIMGAFTRLDRKLLPQRRSLNLLKRLQREIKRGKISSGKNPGTTPTKWHKEMAWIQDKLVKAINVGFKTGDPLEEQQLNFDLETVARFTAIVKGHKVFPSLRILLRFIGLSRKPTTKEAVGRLQNYIQKQEDSGMIRPEDPGADEIPKVKKSLAAFMHGKSDFIKAQKRTLDGVTKTLQGCGCSLTGLGDWDELVSDNSLKGLSQPAPPLNAPVYLVPPPRGAKPVLRRSTDPRTGGKKRLPFTGRWKELFNEPSSGFTVLLWGKAKSGKSTLSLDFAHYLAKNFGPVLYASLEEDPDVEDGSFERRESRLGAVHPRLMPANHLPGDLRPYDFVIVDSVSWGKMGTDLVKQLIEQWPQKSFVFITHATNDGLPRGGMVYKHLVDVLVSVDQGHATADGRYGPGQAAVRFK